MADNQALLLYYEDLEVLFDVLNATEFLELMRITYEYAKGGNFEISTNKTVYAMSLMIKNKTDRNIQKYKEISENRREAGRKGGLQRQANSDEFNQNKANQANATFDKQKEQKQILLSKSSYKDKEQDKDKDNIYTSSSAGAFDSVKSEYSDSFNRFWEIYPRKTAKKEAYKAWKKINPNNELLVKVLRAVDCQRTSRDWQREDGRYIPHASTWLNQGRWEDEIRESEVMNDVKLQSDFIN